MLNPPQPLIIYGVTQSGQRFRPSDWAERLAGVLSSVLASGQSSASSSARHLSYSPFVFPRVIDGVRCVVVDPRLREKSPLAWQFACDFAQDNTLKTTGPLD